MIRTVVQGAKASQVKTLVTAASLTGTLADESYNIMSVIIPQNCKIIHTILMRECVPTTVLAWRGFCGRCGRSENRVQKVAKFGKSRDWNKIQERQVSC